MNIVKTQRTMEFDATPEQLWPLLANTEKLNREMGFKLPTFNYRAVEGGGTEAFASLAVGPLQVRYREHPFEWVQERFYSIRRTFDSGPIAEVVGRVDFEPIGSRTRVRVSTSVECRFLSPVGKAFAIRSLNQLEAACRGFREYLAKSTPTAYPRESGRPPIDADRLEKGRDVLSQAGVVNSVNELFCDFLRNSPAADLVAFRPLELAVRLQVDPAELLKCCLLATRAGLTDLSWRVMCPYCRSNKDLASSLSELAATVHCEACNIDYGAGFDENVEVVFTVSKSLRAVDVHSYCIGGPQSAVHACAQLIVEAGQTCAVDMDLGQKIWQIGCLQASNRPRLVATPSGASACLFTFEKGLLTGDSETVAGRARLAFVNRSDRRIVVRVEEAAWTAKAVTAAEVASLQIFRDNFSSEVLAPGVEIGVSHVCILFTDLKGSTRMYREQGDAPSYAIVRKHFSRLRRTIEANGGALVKTIGDAVMASFHDPANAVRAALEIQAEDDPMVTRMGLHWGPAIAVNANDILDYFGRTVNLASRLQKHSLGGDVILSAASADEVGVRSEIATSGASVESFCADVPDVENGMCLVRLRPAKPIMGSCV